MSLRVFCRDWIVGIWGTKVDLASMAQCRSFFVDLAFTVFFT